MLKAIRLDDFYWQFPLVLLLIILAKIIEQRLPRKTELPEDVPGFKRWFFENTTLFIIFGLFTVTGGIGFFLTRQFILINAAWVLLGLWLIVALLSVYSRERFAVRLLALTAYLVIALHLLGWLEATILFLEEMTLDIGSMKLSLYGFFQGLIILIILLWLAQLVSGIIEKRIQETRGMSPSIKVLMGKGVRIILITFAILVTIDTLGLDLTVLTVLSGGLGLGIGFGLQKWYPTFLVVLSFLPIVQ